MKYNVEISADLEIEADSEKEAISIAQEKITDDIDSTLFFDVEEVTEDEPEKYKRSLLAIGMTEKDAQAATLAKYGQQPAKLDAAEGKIKLWDDEEVIEP